MVTSSRPSTASSQRSNATSADNPLNTARGGEPSGGHHRQASSLTKLADLGLGNTTRGLTLINASKAKEERLEGGLTSRQVTSEEYNPIFHTTRQVKTAKPSIGARDPGATSKLHSTLTHNNYSKVLEENPQAFHRLSGPCSNALEVLGGNQRDSVPGFREAMKANDKAFHRPQGEFSKYLDQARLYRFNYLERGWKIDLPDTEKRDVPIAIDEELKGKAGKQYLRNRALMHTPNGSRRPYSAPAPRPGTAAATAASSTRGGGVRASSAHPDARHASRQTYRRRDSADEQVGPARRAVSASRTARSSSRGHEYRHTQTQHKTQSRPHTASARVAHQRHYLSDHAMELELETLQNNQGVRLSPRGPSASSDALHSTRRHKPDDTEIRTRDRRRVQSARRQRAGFHETTQRFEVVVEPGALLQEGEDEVTRTRHPPPYQHRRISIASQSSTSRPVSRTSSRGSRRPTSAMSARSQRSDLPGWALSTRESTLEDEREDRRAVREDLDEFETRLRRHMKKSKAIVKDSERPSNGHSAPAKPPLSYTLRHPSGSVPASPSSVTRQT